MDKKEFSSEEMQLVTFVLGQESFGVDIMNVQEIIRIPAITVIPQAPAYVEGITNLRGNILPVIDTRSRFGMDKSERDISSRVIVVDVRGNKVGLIVDAVSEVLRVESNRIEAAPEMVSGVDASSIAGVVKVNNGKRLVMILEASRLCKIDQVDRIDKANVRTEREMESRKEEKAIEEVQLVSFLLGNEEFALEIEHVREIIRYPEIVKVPNMPDYIKGVISLRDTLMPIIDMRIKLGTSDDTVTDSTRVVVVDVDSIRIGLVVDRVYEVARIARDTIFPPPQAISGETRDRLKGIARLDKGKRIIMLLEPREIMTREELEDIGQLDSSPNEEKDEENTLQVELDEEQMVVFKLAGEQYGVRITQVQEINRLSQITKVPRAAKFVEGVVNLRGDVIPVIDLRKRFEIESKDYTEFTRIIVSDINNKKIGIIVDEVMEVLRIPGKLVEEAPDILNGNQAQSFMNGIANLGNRMIMMLNLENILVEKEWQKIADIGKADEIPAKKVPKLKKQG
ncbi:MAG: chemotaxis protein [Firmicutes bacterium HGW-Firmicutes-15]|nr:MAG: chemotaxis protein [Firmicutes bacterium HGW-Firmicutes-15]